MNSNNKSIIPTVNGKYDLEYLYQETVNLVFYIISRLVSDSVTTQDLVQDTYISAFDNIHQLQGNTLDDFRKWISKIASNKAKDYLKKKKPILFTDFAYPESESNEIEIEDETTFDRPDLFFHKKELSEMVQTIMERLPEDQRLCIFKYYFEELSIKEIAEDLDLSVNTVKSRLRYGREKIKEMVVELTSTRNIVLSFTPFSIFVYGLVHGEYYGNISIDIGKILGVNMFSKIISRVREFIIEQQALVTTFISLGAVAFAGGILFNDSKIETIELNLFDNINVVFEGENGKGYAKASIIESEYVEIYDKLKLEFDTNQNLSNGDEILLTIKNVEILDEYNVNFKENQKKYKVSGLIAYEWLDIKDYLNLSFSGTNGKGILNLELIKRDVEINEFFETLTFYPSKTNNLSNGETIVISVEETQSSDKYRLLDKTILVEVDNLKSEPVIVETVESRILAMLNQYMQPGYIYNVVERTSHDYYGNTLNAQKKDMKIINKTVGLSKENFGYLSLIEIEFVLDNRVHFYNVLSKFSDEIRGPENIIAVSKDKNLNQFIHDYAPNSTWSAILE